MKSYLSIKKIMRMVLCFSLAAPQTFLQAADFAVSPASSSNQQSVSTDQPAKKNPDLKMGSPDNQSEKAFSAGALSSGPSSSLTDEERAALQLALDTAKENERLADIDVTTATQAEKDASSAVELATPDATSKKTLAAIKKAISAQDNAKKAFDGANKSLSLAESQIPELDRKLSDAAYLENLMGSVKYDAEGQYNSAKDSRDQVKYDLANARAELAAALKDPYDTDGARAGSARAWIENATMQLAGREAELKTATTYKSRATAEYNKANSAYKSAWNAFNAKEKAIARLYDKADDKKIKLNIAVQKTIEAQRPLLVLRNAEYALGQAKINTAAKTQALAAATAARVAAEDALKASGVL